MELALAPGNSQELEFWLGGTMWYDTKFGRLVSQFVPGSIVVCDKPRCKVKISKVQIVVNGSGPVVSYTSTVGNVYEEVQLWRSLEDLRALRRTNFMKGKRPLTIGMEVFPIKMEAGAYFTRPATILNKVELIHAPESLGNKNEGSGWHFATKIVFHCADGRRAFEHGIYESYVEALRACAQGNESRL